MRVFYLKLWAANKDRESLPQHLKTETATKGHIFITAPYLFQSEYYFIAFARAVHLLAALPQIADENYGAEVHLILIPFELMMTLEGEHGEAGRGVMRSNTHIETARSLEKGCLSQVEWKELRRAG